MHEDRLQLLKWLCPAPTQLVENLPNASALDRQNDPLQILLEE